MTLYICLYRNTDFEKDFCFIEKCQKIIPRINKEAKKRFHQ